MTRSRVCSSHTDPDAELVHPPKESSSIGGALQVVGQGALAVAHTSLSAGSYVARKSVDLVKAVTSTARRRSSSDVVALVSDPTATGTGRGRTSLIAVGIVGAVVVGGVAFFRSRRFEHPPVAPEPPRIEQIPRIDPASADTD